MCNVSSVVLCPNYSERIDATFQAPPCLVLLRKTRLPKALLSSRLGKGKDILRCPFLMNSGFRISGKPDCQIWTTRVCAIQHSDFQRLLTAKEVNILQLANNHLCQHCSTGGNLMNIDIDGHFGEVLRVQRKVRKITQKNWL